MICSLISTNSKLRVLNIKAFMLHIHIPMRDHQTLSFLQQLCRSWNKVTMSVISQLSSQDEYNPDNAVTTSSFTSEPRFFQVKGTVTQESGTGLQLITQSNYNLGVSLYYTGRAMRILSMTGTKLLWSSFDLAFIFKRMLS